MKPASDRKSGADAAEPSGFPIVGIGASAGGLAAFEAFFGAMPGDPEPGMAFVLVQHLAPDHKSILTELIQRCTRMEVFEVEDGMRVRPNCAYIIPPNRDMALMHGKLQLLEPAEPRGRRLPIDFFFKSLAQDQRERAIGIVLSGTGSDGTLGARAIKGEGGLVIAQEPASAEYDGMPRATIATGVADFVVPPADMPTHLLNYATHAFGRSAPHVDATLPGEVVSLQSVFVLLRAQTGHDFSQYKQSTINRRIERRMAVHQIATLDAYVRYLQGSPAEVDALFRDLLIRVTSFFRDAEAFDALREQLAQRVFKGRPPGSAVRAWVPGCATGEEAYSVAILLYEQMEALKQSHKLQVFGTDIDPAAIDQARAGVYPVGIASEISPERLARFFDLDVDRAEYRVKKSIRDLLIFSEQDLIKDPPFSRLDLITCRNLMIYLGSGLQRQLIPLFHYALNPGGLLFLGTSESVGDFWELFTVVHPKAKVYQRRDDIPSLHRTPLGRLFPSLTEARMPLRALERAPRDRKLPLRELTERTLLQHLSAVATLINERGDILYVHGRTGRYLEPSPGESSMNLLAMARQGLRRDATIALHDVVATGKTVRRPGLRVKTNGDFSTVDLTICPVSMDPDASGDPHMYLAVLEEPRIHGGEPPHAGASPDDSRPDTADARVAALRQELAAQAEFLRTTTHDLETSNEELKSANEELQSLNEELQSTNEELETSKEELQSVNEELATVNAELQQRVAELSRSNNDLNNLMAGTGVGTIFVDHALRIQRFTPAATSIINLIPTDVGRPIGQLVSNLVGYDQLVPDLRAVLDTLVPKELEVRSSIAWYLLKIRPYRTLENVIEGAVITLTDITQIKQAQASMSRLAAVVHDSHDAILVQDTAGRILAWNPGAERLYGWTEAEALSKNIRDLTPEPERDSALATVTRLARAESIQPFLARRIAKDGHVVQVEITSTALTNESGEVYAVSTTERAHRG